MDPKLLELLASFRASRFAVVGYIQSKIDEKKMHLIEAEKCQKLANLATDEVNEDFPLEDDA